MTCEYNVTGAERKRLVEAVAGILGDSARYLGAPTFAYRVGGVTVSKNGAVSFDESAEDGAMAALADELARRGFVADAAQEAAVAPVAAIPATEALTVGNAPESQQEAAVAETRRFCVEFPREGVTDAAIENLRKLTDSKAALIRKALGADRLDIDITDDAISFPWFNATPEPDMASAAARFLGHLLDVARTQKRVTAREKPVENEKFAFRCFLLKLGFIGAEYKADRKVLLRNLTGSAAFKDGDRRGQGSNDSCPPHRRKVHKPTARYLCTLRHRKDLLFPRFRVINTSPQGERQAEFKTGADIMEKAQIQERIENAAAQHGFSVKYAGRDWLPDIVSENMNFILLGQTDPASDWKSGGVRVNITASASVSRMGGDPTPDELLQTADEIRRGAELLRELQNAGLSYIVNV